MHEKQKCTLVTLLDRLYAAAVETAYLLIMTVAIV